MSVSMPEIIKAEASHANQLGDILGDAFTNDPGFNWAIPRPSLYPAFFKLIAEQVYLPHSHVYIEKEGRGAALWLPPGVSANIPMSLTQLGLVARLVLAKGPGVISRMLEAQETMSKHHPKEPHYYLHAIGARQGCQGQGIGSALLKEVTRICDEEQMPAYLESSSPANTVLYLRHGFETMHTTPLGHGGPPLDFMLRTPRAD